jgi:hypothetical protein
MPTLDLAACEIVVISLAGSLERQGAVDETLGKAGLPYRLVDAVKCNPGRIGCGLSHIKALRAWNGARPLLVLEDDVGATSELRIALDVPDDADAVYIGTSTFGAVEAIDNEVVQGCVIAEDVAPGLLRIHNMLGAHAIIHLTDRWRTAAIEAMLGAMADEDRAPDQGLADIQGHFRVYATKRPFFFQRADLQSEDFRHAQKQEEATLADLPVYGAGASANLVTSGGSMRVRIAREGDRLTWRAS